MRIRTVYSAISVLLIGLLVLTSQSIAEVCPQIHCDCSNLPNENWQKACSAHEAEIKDSCEQNGGQPTAFCSLHGPAAQPLPLAMVLSDVEVVPEDQVIELNRKIAALFWSIRTDSDLLIGQLKKGQLAQGKQIAKLLEVNLDNLFKQQQQATQSLVSYENEWEAIRFWSNYGEDNEKMARDLSKVASELWVQYETLEDAKAKKTYRIVSLKFSRMAGKGFEFSGYAYAQAGKNRKSAKAWERGAKVAKKLMERAQVSGSKESHIQYYRYQVATRLLRASYHWVLGRESEGAKESLEASKEFMNDKTFVDELIQAESE